MAANLELIICAEFLFWVFFFKRAAFLHAAFLLFLCKVAYPCLKLECLVEARGFSRVWNKYVLHHEPQAKFSTQTEQIIKKEVENIDHDLLELLDGER